MSRRVVITGLGAVSGMGIGIDALWEGICASRSAVSRIQAFDPSGFDSQIGAEVPDFKVSQFVPKSYRKATKVMARDIELAVAAADQAVRDAGLVTPGIDAAQPRSYEGPRMGCHIGAGLIAADINELTAALVESTDEHGTFDIHKWGREGMNHLTPLWLLKYLPNMLACHVTIIHDAQGPSNTITCGEASSGLSIGESMRVIQRGAADLGFCGGAESKLNPMAFFRQAVTGRLTRETERPGEAVRPFDEAAAGTVIGEGGGILTLECAETAAARGAKVYAELIGFGAGHTVYPQGGGLEPDPQGRGIMSAIKASLRDAAIGADEIDVVVPLGSGIPSYDRAEAAAIRTMLGERAKDVPVWSATPFIGNCGAAAGGLAAAIAAKMIEQQKLPPRVNCDRPIDALGARSGSLESREIRHVLAFTTSLGGQNAALVLRKAPEQST